ncbi:unnamed protein product, partial [Rotaria socialis]
SLLTSDNNTKFVFNATSTIVHNENYIHVFDCHDTDGASGSCLH